MRLPLKIAVVGCGAVGSFYGARLCRGGHAVHFLLRSDYDAVRAGGVRIESVEGDFTAHPIPARTSEEIGPCDVVLVALKTTANAQLPRLMPPLLGPATVVISLQNGLGDEEQLAQWFGAPRIWGGLCFVCLNRVAPGFIRHSAHGLIVLGEHGRRPSHRTQQLAEALEQAAIRVRVTEDLARAHWEKLVWNIPFNGLGVAGVAGIDALEPGASLPRDLRRSTLPTDALLGDLRWERIVRELMLEVIAAANALGHGIAAANADEQIERTRVMGAYKASTLLDFEAGRELELPHLFLEPRRRAQLAGVATPRLDALCQVLQALAERRAQPTGPG